MKKSVLTKNDFTEIADYVTTLGVKLLVIDFNGVLDDYYSKKYEFLRALLGEKADEWLPELFVAIDRAYMTDRSATIEQSVRLFLETKGYRLSDEQADILEHHMFESYLTDEARDFLDSLTIPFVIYTSLSTEQATRALGSATYDLFTRDHYEETKPSIANLRLIMNRYGVLPHEICVVGDGLIDDLMPASLIGAHTLLVSPYADKSQQSTKL